LPDGDANRESADGSYAVVPTAGHAGAAKFDSSSTIAVAALTDACPSNLIFPKSRQSHYGEKTPTTLAELANRRELVVSHPDWGFNAWKI